MYNDLNNMRIVTDFCCGGLCAYFQHYSYSRYLKVRQWKKIVGKTSYRFEWRDVVANMTPEEETIFEKEQHFKLLGKLKNQLLAEKVVPRKWLEKEIDNWVFFNNIDSITERYILPEDNLVLI